MYAWLSRSPIQISYVHEAQIEDFEGKDLCKLSRELLEKRAGLENILLLKISDGWAKDSEANASALSWTFASKSRLPDPQTNEFSDIHPHQAQLHRFVWIRRRGFFFVLSKRPYRTH